MNRTRLHWLPLVLVVVVTALATGCASYPDPNSRDWTPTSMPTGHGGH